ncbi:MAG TPA: hypothetical protein VGJ23_00895 [Gaiellaceae bacterium]
MATVTLYYDDARYWGDRPPDAVYYEELGFEYLRRPLPRRLQDEPL